MFVLAKMPSFAVKEVINIVNVAAITNAQNSASTGWSFIVLTPGPWEPEVPGGAERYRQGAADRQGQGERRFVKGQVQGMVRLVSLG